MLINLTLNELKHLALQQLGLESRLICHTSGVTNLISHHVIVITNTTQSGYGEENHG